MGKFRRILGSCCIMALLLIISGATVLAAPFVISDRGVAQAVVMLPAKPTDLESFAAEELTSYLEKMSGGKFKVLKEGPGVKAVQPIISIGLTSLAGAMTMQGSPEQNSNREAFRVVRKGNMLLICGNKKGDAMDLGTLWGVYGFLQKIGVGWYLEDPLFYVIPKKPTITIENLDFTDAPSMQMRGSGGQADGIAPDNKYKRPEYGAGNGSQLGYPYGGREVWFSHMFHAVLTPEVLQNNPEFTKDGLCMTNPKLRQLFVDYTLGRFHKWPGLYASSLFPADNGGPSCNCPDCQKLLKLGKDEHTAPGMNSKSDYLVDFYNGVARELKKELPNGKVIGAAYVSYLDPPVQTRVDPNVIMLLTPLTDTTELHPAMENIVKGWRAMGAKELYWYGYDMGNEPMPNEIARRFHNYRRWHLEGLYIEQRPDTAVSGINYYLESRLSWNWDSNVDDLLQKFCFDLFGQEAGRLMVNFWYAWEQKNYLRADQLIKAAEAVCAGDEVKTKRLRYFGLGLQMVTGDLDMKKFANEGTEGMLQRALDAARKCVAARDAVNSEYGPGLSYRELDGNGRYVGAAEQMLQALEKAVAFTAPKMPQMQPGAGPLLLLTNNLDEPVEKRLATGVTVTYDPPINWCYDYPAGPSKLFNGGYDDKGSTSVGTFWTPVLNVTLDLQKEYEIDKVEVWLRDMLPFNVDVLTSIDGKEFQKVEQLFPNGKKGWVRTGDLGLKARYVRLTMVTFNNVQDFHQVKVWGREIDDKGK